MSMFQSLSFMVSHTNEIVGSFSCVHSRMVIGMLSLTRVPHAFTNFCLTFAGANGSPSGPTSHCQPTFWLGLVSVLWRNGRIRIRRAKRRKSVNRCMYIYSCILINSNLHIYQPRRCFRD